MELHSCSMVLEFPGRNQVKWQISRDVQSLLCFTTTTSTSPSASTTLQGTNISPQNGILKMIFLFPRWDMLIPWRATTIFSTTTTTTTTTTINMKQTKEWRRVLFGGRSLESLILMNSTDGKFWWFGILWYF